MKYILSILLIMQLASCDTINDSGHQQITNLEGYQIYLKQNENILVDSLKNELKGLQLQFEKDTTRIVVGAQIATTLDELYNLTGQMDYLNESVRFRESVSRNTYIKPENAYRSLAQAYIKQHEFKKAYQLMSSFTQQYSSGQSKMIQFDLAMELGNFEVAEQLLSDIRDINDYNYLIRAAKWNDHIGQLSTTISLMERAMTLAEESGQRSRMLWSYSNIADYYGHNGDLDKSYQYYLKTLELDPHNTYALKGIAWIAFSNDNAVDDAIHIVKRLKERHPLPDYDLLLADMVSAQGDETREKKLKTQFLQEIKNPSYGSLYNAYAIEALIDTGKKEEAVALAARELENRSTPETNDLYSYALLQAGEIQRALEHQQQYVIGKTYEPVAQLHTALIYKANNMTTALQPLKEELLETRYELGPNNFKIIQSL